MMAPTFRYLFNLYPRIFEADVKTMAVTTFTHAFVKVLEDRESKIKFLSPISISTVKSLPKTCFSRVYQYKQIFVAKTLESEFVVLPKRVIDTYMRVSYASVRQDSELCGICYELDDILTLKWNVVQYVNLTLEIVSGDERNNIITYLKSTELGGEMAKLVIHRDFYGQEITASNIVSLDEIHCLSQVLNDLSLG